MWSVLKNHASGVYLQIIKLMCSYKFHSTLQTTVLHRVRASVFSFNFQNFLFSLSSPSSCLRLLLRLSVSSIPPSNLSSTTCFKRQFLLKKSPLHLTFHLFILCRIFLFYLTLCYTSLFPTWSVQIIFYIFSSHSSKLFIYSNTVLNS